MTNAQFYVAIGVPFFTILMVWLGTSMSNRRSIDDLRASIEALRSEMHASIEALRSEMKMGFDAVNQRLDRVEARMDRIDNEIRIDHERRISILEDRLAKAS